MISVHGSGNCSPSEGSDISEEDDPRYKINQRLKYKHKRSFRLRRRKQGQQLQQTEKSHPPPLGDSHQFSALTSDNDLFSTSCKFSYFSLSLDLFSFG